MPKTRRMITSNELKRLVFKKRLTSWEIAQQIGCSEIYIKKLRQKLMSGDTWK